MAESNIKETTENVSTFNRIIKDTGTEITKLIPTLGSFFAVFQGAQIASSVKQMADFYQGFKNLSYQMGKSNTMSKEFLKGIYKVKIATGDTLDNLNEITIALVKNRVEGGKSLQFLTKQVSLFAEATGASVSTSSQLAGQLYRIGHLGPQSINSIMTSMLKVQRTFGLTSEEVENLSQNIIETTTELSNLGKTSSFIENFQKGTIKLAAAFRAVGLEASEATNIVDRLLDIDRLEDNMLLYSKMGISIQDAVAGNIDPNMMTERLQMVGKEISSMSRPAGAALAKQMGISYRQALQFQNLRQTGDISTGEGDLEKMTKEQRTLWTKIEKFFNSGIGWIASQFLENPLMFGGIIAISFMTFGKKVMSWMKQRFNAIAETMGYTIANAVDQGLNKSQAMKELRKNAGLKSGKISRGSLLDRLDASAETARNRGITSMVNWESSQNALASYKANYSSLQERTSNKIGELQTRRAYLAAENRNKPEQWWTGWNIRRLEAQRDGLAATDSAEAAFLEGRRKRALNRLSAEQIGLKYLDAKNAFGAAEKGRTDLTSKISSLKDVRDITQQAIDRAKTDKNFAHELDSLTKSMENINKEMADAEQKLGDFTKASTDAENAMNEMRNTGKLTADAILHPEQFSQGATPQHEFWWQKIGAEIKSIGVSINEGIRTRLHKINMGYQNWKQHPIMNSLTGIGKVLSFGFGMLKRFLLPMGLGMAGMIIVSKILQRFQPLFEQLMPIFEGIFDAIAKIIAPIIKLAMKLILPILKGVYNAVVGIANFFGAGIDKKIDFDKIMTNIENWDVGKKMDKQAESEEGVIMKKDGSGNWIAQNPDKANAFWSGHGLGEDIRDIQKILKEISDASKATVAAVEDNTNTQVSAINSEAIKGLWGKYKSYREGINRPREITMSNYYSG